MLNPAPTQWLHKALLCALVALGACHTGPSANIDPDRDDPRISDSVRTAQVERGRSSATQAIDFTPDERQKYNRVEQMLQSRFSGVQVVPSGGSYRIIIRGTSTLGTSRGEPLIIIDGASRSNGDLANLSPREVQRIEVIKDGAASIYGSRGSNGVIKIITEHSP